MSSAPSIQSAAATADFAVASIVEPSPSDAVASFLHAAAIVPLEHTGWLRVTGDDRVRWLNGMATNSIQALTPGEGCYNFFLNAQGRIQCDATAFLLEDSILLETGSDQLEKLLAMLDHFIIMDDVELKNVSAELSGLLISGPQAPAMLCAIGLDAQSFAPMHLGHFTWKSDQPVTIVHAYSPLVPRFELWSSADTILAIAGELTAAGAKNCDSASLEQLRILEGTPCVGADLRDKDLPQETAQTRALHFSKGCYLGQEIVERIRSRGSVHRTFSGFTLAGEPPAPGTPLFSVESPEKSVGELTSIAPIQLPGRPVTQFALGYIRREVLERGSRIEYLGGVATPSALPFTAALTQP